VFDDFSV
jgi:adenylosuccinate lyase